MAEASHPFWRTAHYAPSHLTLQKLQNGGIVSLDAHESAGMRM
ncbi:hypothetical protein F4827_003376 [Paraburkholderia bannensis]|uniref:Uncharacterized protein n=1 Tax=Paraburkholderia bannensis TaxID=765414 RepID=A0A7W9TZE1_9BURK|nr:MULTISPECIES: hypothetical protein [Paraburkholderia]MBB3258508.1 hypothetical protein [Paraburkholderia sp. WP4_3_2]MBB6103521.1 hypothetical protein [Paraburkholderia bannensis]